MKTNYFIPLTLALTFTVGFFSGMAVVPDDVKQAGTIINYAAETPTTQEGGEALRKHPVIGAITNILVEPGKLSVYGRNGSRIWYYPPEKK